MLSRFENYTTVHYVDAEEASEMYADPLFVEDEVMKKGGDGELHEIVMRKRRVVMRMPVQVGFFVLNMAKLFLLRFVYEVLPQLRPTAILQSDTDNIYLATDCTYEEFLQDAQKRLSEDEYRRWFVRTDSAENRKFDERTPGLFKLEGVECVKFLATSAKCYVALDQDHDVAKAALRGTQRRPINDGLFSKKVFERVLRYQRHPHRPSRPTAVNRMMRYNRPRCRMLTCSQRKIALNFLYLKRRGMAHGWWTEPLELAPGE